MRDVSDVPDDPQEAFNLLDEEKQTHVLDWIGINLMPVETFSSRKTAHQLKNLYQFSYKGEDRYLTNSEFTGAMIKAGYKAKHIKDLTWRFNISKKSPVFENSRPPNRRRRT